METSPPLRVVTESPLRFDTEYGGWYLLCPACGGAYLHHDQVHVYEPYHEDAKTGLHLTVTSHWTADHDHRHPPSMDFSPRMAGNPSNGRNSLTIRFWCESCPAYSRLVLVQYAGSTTLAMVVTGEQRPEWPAVP